MSSNEQVRREMAEIQAELNGAIHQMLAEVGHKLKPKERAEIETEFAQLDELLERLKTGLVWVALFGKTSVGKSAIANALLGEDRAKVGVELDLTGEAHHYEKQPWMLVDIPGTMGRREFELLAVDEAKKAHGHLFIVDQEPLGPEIELFDMVHDALPNTPKIVFVNKWEDMNHKPSKDRDTVRARIQQKMGKYVKSPDYIVYGSAMRFDAVKDDWVRQEIPQLLDRMYEDAGTLGQVMNVLDPANRAAELGNTIRDRIMAVRLQIARRVISSFGAASVAGGFLPFSQLIVTPGVLASMVFTLFRIMGRKENKEASKRIAGELLKASAQELGVEIAGAVVAETALGGISVLGPIGFLIGMAGLAGMGYYRYRRTVILGEVTLEFIKNDCSWAGMDRHAVIVECRNRAVQRYMRLTTGDGFAAE